MRLWIKILFMTGGIYVGGVVTGFFISPSYQNQTKIIGQTATVVQYFAIIGVALAMWKIIADWYRENVLEYDGLFMRLQHYSWAGKDTYRPAYYLRIKKKRGRGRAENCDGLITIKGTEINDNTVWEGDIPYSHISIQKNLKLFEVRENDSTHEKELVFRSNPFDSREKVTENRIQYTDELEKRIISVKLGSSNASVPSKPFVRTIKEIIENAQQE